jgi:hypothetical protein
MREEEKEKRSGPERSFGEEEDIKPWEINPILVDVLRHARDPQSDGPRFT